MKKNNKLPKGSAKESLESLERHLADNKRRSHVSRQITRMVGFRGSNKRISDLLKLDDLGKLDTIEDVIEHHSRDKE